MGNITVSKQELTITWVITWHGYVKSYDAVPEFDPLLIFTFDWWDCKGQRQVHIMNQTKQDFMGHFSDQIIATSHNLSPNGGLVREILLFQTIPGC